MECSAVMHAQVSAWRNAVPVAEWAKLLVVQGGPMPRKENVAVQYFAKLLGVPGECEQRVYHESVYDEAKSMRRRYRPKRSVPYRSPLLSLGTIAE
jgi:hypothetical protein